MKQTRDAPEVVPKICGIETEYGIIHKGCEYFNPVASSSLLINAYLSKVTSAGEAGTKVDWDFEDESPACDARDAERLDGVSPEIETHLVNAVLPNGSRYYVDHAHPEISGPECVDARTAVLYDQAGDLILLDSMAAAAEILPPDEEIVVYKNNSDGKGNSYGCHENYLMNRSVPFGRIVRGATTHFVTRQIYCGAGKVGSEANCEDRSRAGFQISQRADFMEEEIGLETTLKRPIVNTRDEPHADSLRYRRFHVIAGDANVSQVAAFLKIGTTQMVLALVEADLFPNSTCLEKPVAALRSVSGDLSLSKPLRLADGKTATALNIQWLLLERCAKYCDELGAAAVGESAPEVLRVWERTLTDLETDPLETAGTLDWVAKYRLIDAYRERRDLNWDDARLRALDLQYHDLRPERSVASRIGLQEIVSEDEVRFAKENPPEDTRAYFRGRCLQRFGKDVVAANWDSVVFHIGNEQLRRIPMMEPAKGTAEHLADLFEECETPAELINRLQQPERIASDA